jgi:hypothetical protein
VALWLLRAAWAILYWTFIVLAAAVVTTWSAVEEGVREFGQTAADGFRSPSALRHLPRNLIAYNQRRRRTRAALRRSALYWSESNVIGVMHELQDLPEQDVGPSALARAGWAASQLADPRFVPYVLPLLTHADEEVRFGAVETLGACKYRDAEPSLVALLDDGSALVRMSSAAALGHIGAVGALDVLRRVASDDADQDVRLYASRALLQLGSPRPAAAIEAELRQALSTSWWHRKRVVADWRAIATETAPEVTVSDVNAVRAGSGASTEH